VYFAANSHDDRTCSACDWSTFKPAPSVSFYALGYLEIAVGIKIVINIPSGPDAGNVGIALGALVHRDAMVATRPTIRMATDSELALREAPKAKVELSSVGPCDNAKNIGWIGRYGQIVCCSAWLDKFVYASFAWPRNKRCRLAQSTSQASVDA
jgi:hypothetical protein